MVPRLNLNFSMSKEAIKQAILQNKEFVDFLASDNEKGFIFFTANHIPFVVFHIHDGDCEIYLSTLFIGGLDAQVTGSFVDRVKAAIKEVRAEVYK